MDKKESVLIDSVVMGDAFIAATALYLNIPLFTLNKKDFKFIKDLELYVP